MSFIVMLAAAGSTKVPGDQLWVKIMGPASCGKSTLCEALSVCKEYVVAKSTIRGFHSGFKTDRAGDEDHSLISRIKGKTLITKDGDTLLTSPNRDQIFSEARDLYDRTSRADYRNSVRRDYEGVDLTWILCGTGALSAIDSSELGERFISCFIMETIDDELEDSILWRVANRVNRNMAPINESGATETGYDPDMVKMMQLTGGYVKYLRENATALLGAVHFNDAALKRCILLSKFVAYMRARPSLKQTERAEREFAARLVSQLVRLAKCVAMVLGKKNVDKDVLQVVTKCAMDTSYGSVLKLTKKLYATARVGAEIHSIELWSELSPEKVRTLLRFLRRIRVVESYHTPSGGHSKKHKWRLTPLLTELYKEIFHSEEVTRNGD